MEGGRSPHLRNCQSVSGRTQSATGCRYSRVLLGGDLGFDRIVFRLIDISNIRAAIPPVFRDTVTLRLYNRLCTRLEMLFYWTFFGTSEKVAITSQKLKISFLSPKFELCYLLENICQLEWSVPSSLDNKWYEKCLTSLIFSIFYLVKIFNIWPHQYFYFNLKVGSALNSEN